MSALTGSFVGSGIATTAAGAQVPYRLVIPAKTTENLATIGLETKRWRATMTHFQELASAGKLSADVARRARFAEEVLALVGSNIQAGIAHQLVAQAADGRILGTASYDHWPPSNGALNLEAIDPEHFVGSPGVSQLRGVGTAVVAGVAEDMLKHGVMTLYIHPLDDAARQFWMGRGFVVCGKGGLHCIQGRAGIEKLIQTCHTLPDCGGVGETCLLCGTIKLTEAYRLPQLRGPAPNTIAAPPGH